MDTNRTIERLEQLIRVARAVDPDVFDMGCWTDQNDCGTTHCIGGWIRLDPWWIENTEIADIFVLSGDYVYPSIEPAGNYPKLERQLAALMGIGQTQARYLFGMVYHATGGEGIETLEDVIGYAEVLIARKRDELDSASGVMTFHFD